MKKLLDNKIFKLAFGIIKGIFFILICAYLAFIIIQNVSGNRSVFGYRMFDIASSSMSGVYEVHDVILVKDFDTSKLKVGDDIVYNGERAGLDGKLVTHRIISIENNEKEGGRIFTTKGVKNDIEDPAIHDNQVIGKVVGIVPIISPVNHIVKSQVGFFLCVFCPIVIIISLEVFTTLTEMKEEKIKLESEYRKEKKDESNDEKEEKDEELSDEEVDDKNGEDKDSSDEEVKEEDSSDQEVEVLDLNVKDEDSEDEKSEEDELKLKVDKFLMVNSDEDEK